jgi:hypothetical protein
VGKGETYSVYIPTSYIIGKLKRGISVEAAAAADSLDEI